MLIIACSFPATQRLHSFKFTLVNKIHLQHPEAAVRCLGWQFVRMRTRSLVPRPKTAVNGLEARLVHEMAGAVPSSTVRLAGTVFSLRGIGQGL